MLRQRTAGVIIRQNRPNQTRFVIFGLDERGTQKAAEWFVNNWEYRIKNGFEANEFLIIIEIGMDNSSRVVFSKKLEEKIKSDK